jgi:hypothetical protein
MLRPAVLTIALAACASGPVPAAAPLPAASDTSEAAVVAREEAAYQRRADSLRARILARAEWTDMGADSCRPGAFRSFAGDTATADSARGENADSLAARLERLIIARGVGGPVDTREGHDLLRTVISWEADLERPRWDVPRGQPPRETIAAGLAGQYRNPETGSCDRYVPNEGLVFVIPAVTDFQPPKARTGQLEVVTGEDGLKAVRDRFFVSATDADPIFTYSRIAPVVLWGSYAVVTVDRPAELRGVHPLNQDAGGATYIFHRVEGAWRLLVIVRSWA